MRPSVVRTILWIVVIVVADLDWTTCAVATLGSISYVKRCLIRTWRRCVLSLCDLLGSSASNDTFELGYGQYLREIRQQVVIAPAWVAKCLPVVILGPRAASPDHDIQRAPSSEKSSLRHGHGSWWNQAFLRRCQCVPLVIKIKGSKELPARDHNLTLIFVARLDQHLRLEYVDAITYSGPASKRITDSETR